MKTIIASAFILAVMILIISCDFEQTKEQDTIYFEMPG